MRDEPDLSLGTPRYMAPEVLNGTIDVLSFEAFKKADVYSLGLVFHEMCQLVSFDFFPFLNEFKTITI